MIKKMKMIENNDNDNSSDNDNDNDSDSDNNNDNSSFVLSFQGMQSHSSDRPRGTHCWLRRVWWSGVLAGEELLGKGVGNGWLHPDVPE